MTAIVRTYTFSAARLAPRNDAGPIAIDPKQLQLTLDKSWAPYVQGTVTCGPLTAAALAAADPRTGYRARWRLTQTQPDGSSFYRDFDLQLRSRAQSWATGEVQLGVASDEAIAQDYGYPSAQTYPGAPGSAYRSSDVAQFALGGVAANALPTVPFDSTPNVMIDYTDAGAETGTSAWDWAGGLAEAAGAWLFCDEAAGWHWVAPTWAADTTQYTLSDADAVIDVQDTVSRDDPSWATAVVIAYTANSPTQFATSSAGIEPRKTILLSRNRRRPANGSATKPRQQAQLHGRSLRIRAAADIRVRPNMTYLVRWLGQTATGTVQSVAFDFPTGTMDVLLNI